MKSSKKVVAFALAATMLFGNVVGVLAADTDVDVSDNKVEFTTGGGTGTGPTDPVDPENPDVTIDPDDKERPTGNEGPLRLDVVPVFDFGTQQITAAAKEYTAELPVDTTTDEEIPYYVQVTDIRGTGEGWSLTAKMTSQFSDGTHTLDGAKIDLLNVASKAQTGSTAPSGTANGTLEYDTVNDSSQTIATALTNEGMGVSAVRFGDSARDGGSDTAKDSVKLTIPVTTQVYKATYTATIKWTLGAVL